MKKFKTMKRITYVIASLVILGGVWGIQTPHIFAQETCTLNSTDLKWSGVGTNPMITNLGALLTINTTNCKNFPLVLQIVSASSHFFTTDKVTIKTPDGNITESLSFTTGSEDQVQLRFQAHEDNCWENDEPDCQLYLIISSENNIIVNTQSIINSIDNENWQQSADFLVNNGVLFANCDDEGNDGDTDCDQAGNNWELKASSGTETDLGVPEVTSTLDPEYDTESPCYSEDKDNDPDNGNQPGYLEDCYEFLAPLPGFTTENGGELVTTEDGRVGILDVTNFQVGDYINSIFQIALGVLTLIAVIMIVIAGVQYMTVESFHGKSDAKNRIKGSATGLVLALGIYIILGTINPELLEVNFGKDIENVALEGVQLSPEQLAEFGNDYNEAINQGVTIPPDNQIAQDEGFIAYLYHQQGPGGARKIIYAAMRGTSQTPWGRAQILGNNWPSGVNRGAGTPADFLRVWYVVWQKKKTEINTISSDKVNILTQVANEESVNLENLKTYCMIESTCGTHPNMNARCYKGWFQFGIGRIGDTCTGVSNTWSEARKPGCNDVYDGLCNSYGGARYMKTNLSKWNTDKTKIF